MEQSVTVLHSSPLGWTNNTTSLDQCLKNPDAPKHQYILVQNDLYSGGYQLPPELIEYFQIPGHMLSNVYRSSNGFFYWDESYDKAGHLDAHYTCFRVLVKMIKHKPSVSYLWHEVSFFTRWTPDSCTVLCLAAPESMLHRLKDALGNLWSKLPPSEPYVLHVLIFEVIIALQDASVWSMRDILRNEEKSFLIPSRKSSDFTLLHESRRHFIHSMETLSVAVEILEAIKKQHLTLSSKLGPSIRKPVDTSFRIQAHLEAQTIMLKNLFLRSQSNKERLQNEIGYGENKAVRRDSSAMRTIAVVTMAFLPPTFISAIFSMSFFEFSPPGDGKPGKWSVSEKFWLYWAITIPLIILTMTVWYWREGNYYTFFQKTATITKRTKSRF